MSFINGLSAFTVSISFQPSSTAYRQHHPLLQYLPQKLAEWLANNMSEELNLPDPGDEWSSEALNNILVRCLVSNRRGDNLHTFQCVEFESDLYRGVMRIVLTALRCKYGISTDWVIWTDPNGTLCVLFVRKTGISVVLCV